jgi:uncharacterized protein YdeI (YjbR/CyaY-like superfamily)
MVPINLPALYSTGSSFYFKTAAFPRNPLMPVKPKTELPIIAFADQQAWDKWLKANHLVSPGIWIQLAKKASATPSVIYAEAIETALCYGWIDGQKQSHTTEAWIQKFTPRGRKSIWSKINREKALALIECGKMKAAGLAEVQRAQQDGRWEQAYDSPGNAAVPPDLQAALDHNSRAKSFFKTLESRNRYAILWRIQTAKRVETRAKRIEMFVKMLEKGEKIHT